MNQKLLNKIRVNDFSHDDSVWSCILRLPIELNAGEVKLVKNEKASISISEVIKKDHYTDLIFRWKIDPLNNEFNRLDFYYGNKLLSKISQFYIEEEYLQSIQQEINFKNKMRIMIVGIAKSGTTILTYRAADAFEKTKIVFEPGKQNSLKDIALHYNIYQHRAKNIITKSLYLLTSIPDNLDVIEKFYNKKIWIYRDPRDWMLSRFFYRWRELEKIDINTTLEKIKKKEQNPSKIPFREIAEPQLWKKIVRQTEILSTKLSSLSPDWHIVKYEDFVDGNIEKLNAYLGSTINMEVEVDQNFSRVARSKSYGEWRNWLTDEDVAFFRPILSPAIARLGYDPDDWELNYPTTIDPKLGSEYILKLYLQKNKKS